jgi:competence protein ComEC
VAAGFLLVIYCFMAGASTPVVRATVMSLVFMSAYFLKRDPDIYNSLALAAIFILAFSPRQLFNIGFQLSFVSVFSIAYFYPRLSAFLQVKALKTRLLKLAIEAMLVSFSAWLGTAGLSAYYFKIVSPITVFANLIIVPLSSLVTLCGFSTLIAASLWPAAGRLFSVTTELLVMSLLSINNWLVKLPAAYFYLPGRG